MALDLVYPFTGRWLVQNSPANRVPSHGTEAYATAYAIDFVPVDEHGRTAPFTWESLVRQEPAARFPGFGRPLTAPATGVVVGVHDGEPDHGAVRGFPSIGYALTQRSRAAHGWAALAGNHVVIETDAHQFVALCHLQRGSLKAVVGQRVAVGDELGACGNSGNSTEPHLHLQAMSSPDPSTATAVPITFRGSLPRNKEIVEIS